MTWLLLSVFAFVLLRLADICGKGFPLHVNKGLSEYIVLGIIEQLLDFLILILNFFLQFVFSYEHLLWFDSMSGLFA